MSGHNKRVALSSQRLSLNQMNMFSNVQNMAKDYLAVGKVVKDVSNKENRQPREIVKRQ